MDFLKITSLNNNILFFSSLGGRIVISICCGQTSSVALLDNGEVSGVN